MAAWTFEQNVGRKLGARRERFWVEMTAENVAFVELSVIAGTDNQ